jgi:hypothetical protein
MSDLKKRLKTEVWDRHDANEKAKEEYWKEHTAKPPPK